MKCLITGIDRTHGQGSAECEARSLHDEFKTSAIATVSAAFAGRMNGPVMKRGKEQANWMAGR